MPSPIYNNICKTYNHTRSADPRIVDTSVELLDLLTGSKVLDIGAGTGSYSQSLSDTGYAVAALDPSEVMRQQSDGEHDVIRKAGIAEDIPFDDGEFDAATLILCIHHFTNLDMALKEAARVTGNGKVIIFTYDPNAIDSPWLFH